MLISQALSPIVTPSLREAMLFGGKRAEWEKIIDESALFRHDDATLRSLEQQARREETRRAKERKGERQCMPIPMACIARPHVHRALYAKDIGGVAGVSDTWIDGSFVAIDGGTLKTQSFIDYIDQTHLLTQTTSGNQVAVPSTDATMNNQLVGLFVAGSATRYASSRAASAFKFMHDGTGMTIYMVGGFTFGSAAVMAATSSSTGTAVGFDCYLASAAAIDSRVFPLSPSPVISGTLTTSGWSNNGTATYYSLRHSSASSPNAEVRRKSASVGTTNYANAPSSANPTATLTIGAHNAATFPITMRFRRMSVFRRVLNAAESSVYEQFTQQDTGITP